MKTQYNVSIVKTNEQITFKTIAKAKEFITKWCYENNQNMGRFDIDKKTLIWHVGTFAQPVIQFEKVRLFNN